MAKKIHSGGIRPVKGGFIRLIVLPTQTELYIYMILRGVTKAQMSGDVLKGGGDT